MNIFDARKLQKELCARGQPGTMAITIPQPLRYAVLVKITDNHRVGITIESIDILSDVLNDDVKLMFHYIDGNTNLGAAQSHCITSGMWLVLTIIID